MTFTTGDDVERLTNLIVDCSATEVEKKALLVALALTLANLREQLARLYYPESVAQALNEGKGIYKP